MSIKLREAVESLLDLLDDEAITEEVLLIASENQCHRESLHIDKKLDVLRKAKAVLAEPLRNCDLYDTEYEAWDAFSSARQGVDSFTEEYEKWLFEQAEGEMK